MTTSRHRHRSSCATARVADLVQLDRLLDLEADRLICRLAARAGEWTTSAAERATIARMANEAARGTPSLSAPGSRTTANNEAGRCRH